MALVIITQKNPRAWVSALKVLIPDLDVRIYPDDGNREEIDFALAWHPPLGVFKNYPNLKVIASTGAGVDHILKDTTINPNIIITRVVDDQLTSDMSSYLIAQVMNHMRNISEYKLLQRQKKWQPRNYLHKSDTKIGIMGMGVLGIDATKKLTALGFSVHGWARAPKSLPGIKMYSGKEEYETFLEESNILICLLPLTNKTANILNKPTFNLMPKGAYVINVARGEHLVEDDLLEALDSGHLSGACLDVFREEPLPKDSLLWEHPKVLITPHIASITSPASVAPQIIENYKRFNRGDTLLNVVSREVGY